MRTAKSLHAVAILSHPNLTFDLVAWLTETGPYAGVDASSSIVTMRVLVGNFHAPSRTLFYSFLQSCLLTSGGRLMKVSKRRLATCRCNKRTAYIFFLFFSFLNRFLIASFAFRLCVVFDMEHALSQIKGDCFCC